MVNPVEIIESDLPDHTAKLGDLKPLGFRIAFRNFKKVMLRDICLGRDSETCKLDEEVTDHGTDIYVRSSSCCS
jgi:hypothetical protein